MYKYLTLLVILMMSYACSNNEELQYKFVLHNAKDTGIDFVNIIQDSPENNALVYETFYNGGGVALGDINNDGLLDVYFTGNQVEDGLYLNKGEFQFENISKKAGILNRGAWSTGVSMVDINNDGLLDIYVCKSLYDESPQLRKNELYINQGNAIFKEEANKYNLDDVWRTQEACFFDFDQDGDQDVLLVNQPPNPGVLSPLKGIEYRSEELGVRFLLNQGQHFIDGTKAVGIAHKGFPLSASVCDVNNDGWLDVFISHDYNSPDKLYLNQKGKTFINVLDESCKQISFFSMGTDAGDINNDGNVDLISVDMVASDPYRSKANMGGMNPDAFWRVVEHGGNYQYMYNALHLNNGYKGNIPLYSNIANIAGMASTDWSWSPLMADLDNDGLTDVFITNGIKRDLRFTDGLKKIKTELEETRTRKQSDQSNILKNVDAIKLLQYLPSTKLSNYAFHNINGIEFKNNAHDWGLDSLSFSNGAAYGDLDNDGDLDLIVNNIDDSPFIYENQLNKNNYLRIKPVIDKVNNTVLDVRVELYTNNKIMSKSVASNRGFYSSSEKIAHFGLGSIEKIDSIRIYWDAESYSVITNPPINKTITIAKNEEKIIAWLHRLDDMVLKNFANDLGLEYKQNEDNFDDYSKQILLPHQIGVNDAPIICNDFNNDKLQDVFIGGGAMQPSQLYTQSGKQFLSNLVISDKRECTALVSFDIEGDGDQDIYVATGGNEFENNSTNYRNYFLINNGKGEFKKIEDNFSNENSSDDDVVLIDIDGDDDMDMLVCARHIPAKYPFPASSRILRNDSKGPKVLFTDVTKDVAAELNQIGLVTEAIVCDIDNDNDDDFVLVGEWMPITIFLNEKGKFSKYEIPNTIGWWMGITDLDFNKDGLVDFLVGNIGDNAKYKSNDKIQFSVYYDDFDADGNSDIVLSYEKNNHEVPIRGRSCSSQQIPSIADKLPTYDQFASSSLIDIYGDRLIKSNKITIDEFSSVLLINQGKGKFAIKPLPIDMQISSINHFEAVNDTTFLAVGNFNYTEVETPRLDASKGKLLSIDSDGNMCTISKSMSNRFTGQINDMQRLLYREEEYLLFIPVDDSLKVVKVDELKSKL